MKDPGNYFMSLFLALLFILLPACDQKKGDVPRLAFKVHQSFHSDEPGNPYFFGSILAVCGNSRFIYVCDWKTYSIKIFDLDFNLVKTIGRRGNGPGEFGQLLVDMTCTEEFLFIISINRLYIFSSKGEFKQETVLKFFPQQIFSTDQCLVFKTGGSSGKIFAVTDLKANLIDTFYPPRYITSEKCGKVIAVPGAFLSPRGKLYVLESTSYKIEAIDFKKSGIKKIFSRDCDFQGIQCQKTAGNAYIFEGGTSKILEVDDLLLYFYFDSNNHLNMDLLIDRPDDIEFCSSRGFQSNLYPLDILKTSAGIFLACKIIEDADTLYLCELKPFLFIPR